MNVIINKSIIEDVYSPDAVNEIADYLNSIIDEQLEKVNIDTDLIDSCIDALDKLEENDFSPAFKVIITQRNVLNYCIRNSNASNWKRLNKAARIAIIAAVLATGTLSVNAGVEAVTGVDVLEKASVMVQDKLEQWGVLPQRAGIDVIDGEDEDDANDIETTVTQAVTEEATTGMEETTTESVTQQETTTQPTTAATTKPTTRHHIEVVDGEDEDDELEETTKPTTKPTTTKPSVTQKPAIEPTTNAQNSEAVFVTLKADFDENFKTDYIYGEELSYNGLKLAEQYSDGSEKPVSLKDCNYTKSVDMTKTADYTLKIKYKSCVISIDITVRPDEETRGSKIRSNADYDYLVTNRGAYITKYKGSTENITLNVVDDEKVIAIADSAFANSKMQTITCTNLVKLFDNAFKSCTSLKSINAPNVNYIGNNAFDGCTSLEKTVNSTHVLSIGAAAYRNTAISEITLASGITKIPEGLCEGCSLLTKVIFNGAVTEIGSLAFSECPELKTVSGTASIKTVKAYAFYNDTELDFDSSLPLLEEAGDYAFAYCNSASLGKLSSNIKKIGQYAFAYCYKLSEVKIPSCIKTVPEGAFRGAHISTLTIENGVKVIDDYAFMSTEFRTLVLPDSVESVGTYSLYSIRLREVHFGSGIKHIGENAVPANSRMKLYAVKNTVAVDYAVSNSISYEVKGEGNEED